MRKAARLTAVVTSLALVAVACGGDDDAADEVVDTVADTADEMSDEMSDDMTEEMSDDMMACDTPREMSVQLQWSTQAQFAGYYAAEAKGFFADHCLDVSILEGGVDIIPQTQLANGDTDFAISWVSKALASREAGADIVNIAQIFQRSGTLQVAFADSGISSPADFAGKKIGNWGFGNEYEVFAALGSVGLDPASDVELVGQDFSMTALLEAEIDAAEAMTYNEYAQLLEAVNPATDELYQPEDFTVINYTDEGVGMLQDAIWADAGRLTSDDEYRSLAVSFVAASMEGWIYCRDNVEECQQIVIDAGPTLGASHQLWQMNEINKLIWPSPNGIGFIDQAEWDKTVELSLNTPNLEGTTVLTADPTEGAFTNEIVEEAWTHLNTDAAADPNGAGYAPIEVALNKGGN